MQMTIDRYGNVYVTPPPLGASVGRTSTWRPYATSLTANWMVTENKPAENALAGYLEASSYSVMAGANGPGIIVSGNGGGTSMGVGVMTTQISGGWSYSIPIGRIPVSW